MKTKTGSPALRFVRSVAAGVIISMLFFYGVHVLGKWSVEDYRPDPETTGTILLKNTCAVFGNTHVLRPNTAIGSIGEGIDGARLSGSFMNFTDGHIPAMAALALLLGTLIFILRNRKKSS